ncbi:DUF3575 domain-containing protein [Flavivirga algicola]|uniref:DUF3575 domain-containing protein n=1 Tax=Flavivirga algicola TaxID=2729136 RepID=A0ABX1RUN2_9FLAO|nr:DUF3575 domain-containing protein [Flavivirga algicola]NMH86065.1 DUF3575 domain-containing protein [Flavivirga algicola]
MKKLLLCAVIAVLSVSNVKAQENVVKFNPLALIVGSLEVGYERVVSENQSLQVDLAYTSFDSGFFDYTGFGAGLQYRFYLQKAKEAPEGWFAGPVASYASASANNDFKTSIFAAGGVVGYQWNWEPITLDIYGGPAYYSVDADDPTFDFGFDGIGAKLGLSLGFAF